MPQVLFADGSVSSSRDCGPVWVPEDQVQKETRESTTEGRLDLECTTPACSIVSVCVCAFAEQSQGSTEDEDGRGVWVTTTPSGARIHTVGTTHTLVPITPLLMYKATDPITQEVRHKYLVTAMK